MNRKNLIDQLVARKVQLGGQRKPICICMAQVPRKALCFASGKQSAKVAQK